jgi:hypothetical protein
MRESKYPLERLVSPLPFWYSTPSQILDETVSDLNFLTATHGQDRNDVIIWNFCLEVLLSDWALLLTSYGASKIIAPIRNLTIYPRILFVMVSCLVITFLSKTLSEVDFLTESLLPRILYESRHLCSTKPHLWRNLVGSLPWNLSCRPLVWNLADLSRRASLCRVVCRYSTFLSTLSQSEYIQVTVDWLIEPAHFIPSTPSTELRSMPRSTLLMCYICMEFQRR